MERGATVITGNVTANRVTHISTNDIERALTCTGNAPPLTGTGNQVDDVNSGQGSSFGGGTDNDSLSPGDND